MLTNKPKIAISACLVGQKVRYDGKEKKQPLIVDFFLNEFVDQVELIPFCPEVAIGLGVPRPKIQAVRQEGEQIRILGVENHTQDVTEALKSYAHDFLQQHPDIRHFIVKAKSPSCGYLSTPLFIKEAARPVSEDENLQPTEERYEQIALISGLFVQTILALKPQLHIIDENQLNDIMLSGEQARLHFLQQIENSYACQ